MWYMHVRHPCTSSWTTNTSMGSCVLVAGYMRLFHDLLMGSSRIGSNLHKICTVPKDPTLLIRKNHMVDVPLVTPSDGQDGIQPDHRRSTAPGSVPDVQLMVPAFYDSHGRHRRGPTFASHMTDHRASPALPVGSAPVSSSRIKTPPQLCNCKPSGTV